MKTCRSCRAAKSASEFWWKVPGVRRDTRCKDCDKAVRKAWYEAHREQTLSRGQAYYWANRDDLIRRQRGRYYANRPRISEAEKRLHLLKKYGLTPEDYARMYKEQGGLCKVCREVPNGVGKAAALGVDHNHKTKRVRGLLCVRCNSALGMVRDSRERLDALSAYLATDEAAASKGTDSNLIPFPKAEGGLGA